MAFSTAVSVAAFSVVLTQSFVAVAASTLVPATFLAAARSARRAVDADGAGANAGEADTTGNALIAKAPGVKEAVEALRKAIASVDEIDLLVPKTARIEADFEFEASEALSGEVAGGGFVYCVAIAAGYSALYQTSTRNKIHLEVDFAAVNYKLAPLGA